MAKGVSLHIGVNRIDPAHYAGWSGPLNACEADARAMDAVARTAGFSTTLLLTAAATRAAVTTALTRAARQLAGGDMLLLTYSGHGGRLPDASGDEEDQQDETWCLYDGQLVDDELHALYAGFSAGVRILILSDSCHSGTVAKSSIYGPIRDSIEDPFDFVTKYMPDDVADATYKQNADFYDEVRHRIAPPPGAKTAADVRASVRLLSGCQDYEVSFDGKVNSAFTAAVLHVWGKGSFRGTYDEFHQRVRERLAPRQTPNHFTTGTPDAAFDRQPPFAIL